MSIVKTTTDGKRFIEYGKEVRYFKRDKPELKDFHQFTDRPIAVIGSAPGVLDDFAKVPKDAICISVNFHFLEKGLFDFDFLCFLDSPEMTSIAPYKYLYDNFKGLKISTKMDYTDIYCVDEEPVIIGDSGIFAIWIALYMTSNDVYVCGMNNRDRSMPLYDKHSHLWDRRPAFEPVGPVKYGRWAILYEKAEAPQRMVIFNENVKKYLDGRGYETKKG